MDKKALIAYIVGIVAILATVVIAAVFTQPDSCEQWDVKKYQLQKSEGGMYLTTDEKPEKGYEPFGTLKFPNATVVLTRKCVD